jgi:hypothetical protein
MTGRLDDRHHHKEGYNGSSHIRDRDILNFAVAKCAKDAEDAIDRFRLGGSHRMMHIDDKVGSDDGDDTVRRALYDPDSQSVQVDESVKSNSRCSSGSGSPTSTNCSTKSQPSDGQVAYCRLWNPFFRVDASSSATAVTSRYGGSSNGESSPENAKANGNLPVESVAAAAAAKPLDAAVQRLEGSSTDLSFSAAEMSPGTVVDVERL